MPLSDQTLVSSRAAPQTLPAFHPAWWLPGPHLPTLWAALVRRRPRPDLRRERLELDDGDFVELCWTGSEHGPLVVILHGLEGSCRSRYAAALLERLEAHGWGGVLMQFRGCSGEVNRLARSYHSGDTEDLRFLLGNLRRRFPERVMMAVGYSLGGNVLLKYLGETGAASGLRAAAAVSVPYDLAAAAWRLDRGLSKFYQWHLVRSLRRKVREKFARRSAPIALDRLAEWKTFWSFDENVTAPLHGFRDADDYYTRSSCRHYLKSIVSPTLLLHARNDPFLYPDVIPQAHELPESITLYTAAAGGHVGFVAGRNPFNPRYWIDDCLMTWLGARLVN